MSPKLKSLIARQVDDTIKAVGRTMQTEVQRICYAVHGVTTDQFGKYVSLIDTVRANMSNADLSDADFRQFIRNSMFEKEA